MVQYGPTGSKIVLKWSKCSKCLKNVLKRSKVIKMVQNDPQKFNGPNWSKFSLSKMVQYDPNLSTIFHKMTAVGVTVVGVTAVGINLKF